MLIGRNTDCRCPFCGRFINHWPNDSPNTNPDYYNRGEIIQGHGAFRKKQFFHKSCLKENGRVQKNEKLSN